MGINRIRHEHDVGLVDTDERRQFVARGDVMYDLAILQTQERALDAEDFRGSRRFTARVSTDPRGVGSPLVMSTM